MNTETKVAEHYSSGRLFDNLMRGLTMAGKDPARLTVDELAPVDEFHVGGEQSTNELARRMQIKAGMRVLDVGCGMGGPARVIAAHYDCKVEGIDLTPEFVEVGNRLTTMLELGEAVTLRQCSAVSIPFEAGTFDGAYMIHVGMNIADKASVFREVRRVLKPGAVFGIFDIMRIGEGSLTYPLPWADSEETSFVAELCEYREALAGEAFEIASEEVQSEFGLRFTQQMAAQVKQSGPPALGLHLLMGQKTPLLMKNIGSMMQEGLLAPVQLIARAQ